MNLTHAPRAARAGALAALVGVALSALTVAPAHADTVLYNADDNSSYAYNLNPANAISGGVETWGSTSLTDDGVKDYSGYGASGSLAREQGPDPVKTNTGCPVGYRASSRTFIVTAGKLETPAAVMRQGNAATTLWGFQGNGMTLNSDRASSWGSLSATQNPDGTNAYVVTCDAPSSASGGNPTNSNPIGNSKYFVLFYQVSSSGTHWEVTTDPRPAALTATTTTLAASGVTAAAATLTATVAPTAATGTVQFKQAGVAIGSPVAVTNGTASYSVSGLSASTTYGFTAEYSGDTAYAASASASTSVTTVAAAADSSSSSVNVTVPTVTPTTPTGLKISVKPGSTIALTGAATRTQGAAWSATGSLGNVTVNDDRRVAGAAWTLSGKVTAFTSGSNTVAASNLGWAPAKVSGAGDAGSAVTAGSNGGLSTDQPLAAGTGTTDANVITTVGAGLTLAVPADSAAGDYTATLTLTLI